jgi:hypothetical protein
MSILPFEPLWSGPHLSLLLFFSSCIHRSSTPHQPSRATPLAWSLGSGSPAWSSSRLTPRRLWRSIPSTFAAGLGRRGGGVWIRCRSSSSPSRTCGGGRGRPPPPAPAWRPGLAPANVLTVTTSSRVEPWSCPRALAVAARDELSLPRPRNSQVELLRGVGRVAGLELHARARGVGRAAGVELPTRTRDGLVPLGLRFHLTGAPSRACSSLQTLGIR